jgi:hypothetical protein
MQPQRGNCAGKVFQMTVYLEFHESLIYSRFAISPCSFGNVVLIHKRCFP